MARLNRRQIAVGVSLFVHLVLAIVLLLWYIPNASRTGGAPQAASSPSDQTAAPAPPPRELSEIAAATAEVSDRQIERSLESQLDAASKLTDERKRSELEKNLDRLESIANAESVKQVSEKIAGSLGLDVSQYANKESSAEGPFDVDTSQLSDVSRTRKDDGGWSYQSVMVDANGREMTVPLTEAEGESLYETFQMMKRYPMAEGIYRSVVMPMMQQIMEAQQLELQLPETPVVDPRVELPATKTLGPAESQ
ncbi:MAG: hypothetical protein AAFU85_08545 [Planctomycetota bacterium]